MTSSAIQTPTPYRVSGPGPAPPAPVAIDPRLDWAAVGIPAAVAAVFCLLRLGTRSLGFDEAATVTIAAQHGSALLSAIAHDGGNMSGFYVLLHVLMSWFGNGAALIRLPSALASVVTVVLVGVIGLRLFGRRAAFAAGLLAAVSLPLVFWAQNARGYALMVAFVTGAYLVFISLDTAPRARLWIAYVILMTLGIYSSFVAVLVVPAQLLVLLARGRRRRLRPFGLSLLAIAVLCTPLILLAARRGPGQLFWVPRPTHEIEVQVLQSLTSAGLEPSFRASPTTTLLMILTLTALLAVVMSFVPAWRRGREGWVPALLISWVLVPVGLTFLYSLVFQPLFLPRNLLMSIPAVVLLLGAGLGHRRLPAQAAWAGLVVFIALRALQLVPSYAASPEPWREASAYVLHRAQAGDCLAFYPADGRMAFQYYYARRPAQGVDGTGVGGVRFPRTILPVQRWEIVRPYVEDYATLSSSQLVRRSAGCRRLWFVSSHEGQLNGPASSRSNLARFNVLNLRLGATFAHSSTRQFGYASAIHVRLLSGRR